MKHSYTTAQIIILLIVASLTPHTLYMQTTVAPSPDANVEQIAQSDTPTDTGQETLVVGDITPTTSPVNAAITQAPAQQSTVPVYVPPTAPVQRQPLTQEQKQAFQQQQQAQYLAERQQKYAALLAAEHAAQKQPLVKGLQRVFVTQTRRPGTKVAMQSKAPVKSFIQARQQGQSSVMYLPKYQVQQKPQPQQTTDRFHAQRSSHYAQQRSPVIAQQQPIPKPYAIPRYESPSAALTRAQIQQFVAQQQAQQRQAAPPQQPVQKHAVPKGPVFREE